MCFQFNQKCTKRFGTSTGIEVNCKTVIKKNQQVLARLLRHVSDNKSVL